MKIIRTEKLISKENIDETLMRRIASLVGHEIHLMKMDISRFSIENRYKNQSPEGLLPDGVEINIKGFDTSIRVWNTGQAQGYYVESSKAQYAAKFIDWANLMLEYGFYEAKNH